MSNFKVGDWVSPMFGKTLQLKESHFKGISAMNTDWFNDLKLWQPQKDEFVVLYNFSDGLQKSFRVAQFEQMAHGKGREGQYKDKQGNYFTHCEPFIGTLPSFLKQELAEKETK